MNCSKCSSTTRMVAWEDGYKCMICGSYKADSVEIAIPFVPPVDPKHNRWSGHTKLPRKRRVTTADTAIAGCWDSIKKLLGEGTGIPSIASLLRHTHKGQARFTDNQVHTSIKYRLLLDAGKGEQNAA